MRAATCEVGGRRRCQAYEGGNRERRPERIRQLRRNEGHSPSDCILREPPRGRQTPHGHHGTTTHCVRVSAARCIADDHATSYGRVHVSPALRQQHRGGQRGKRRGHPNASARGRQCESLSVRNSACTASARCRHHVGRADISAAAGSILRPQSTQFIEKRDPRLNGPGLSHRHVQLREPTPRSVAYVVPISLYKAMIAQCIRRD